MKLLWNQNTEGALSLQFPILKSEKTDDGRLMIEGIATSESVDSDNEIIDFDTMKAVISAWQGNIREQHDPKKAVGRALEVSACDDTKSIHVKAFISKGAPDTQEKILDGTLSGFSIGGAVDKRQTETIKTAGVDRKVTRVFVKRMTELSVVDKGANPDTAFALVKAEGDNLVGVGVESFQPEQIWTCNHPEHKHAQKAEAVKCAMDGDLLKEQSTQPSTEPEGSTIVAKDAEKTAQPNPFKEALVAKGLYTLTRLAEVIDAMECIQMSMSSEARYEGDNSPLPERLRLMIVDACQLLCDMCDEETAELTSGMAERDADMIVLSEGTGYIRGILTKATGASPSVVEDEPAAVVPTPVTKAEEALPVDLDLLTKAMSKMDEMSADIEKMRDSNKTLEDRLEKSDQERQTLVARLAVVEKMPAPAKGALFAISKADDHNGTGDGGTGIEPVRNPDGSVDNEATAIKAARASAKIGFAG